MKKKVIGIAALLAAAAAIFFAYRVFSAKSSASNAVEAYNAAVREYNAAIAPFNEAASGIADANNTLQGVLDAAQAVLDKGEKAYEPDTQDELESAVKKAGKAFAEVPVQIDPLEEQALPVSFSTKELELAQHEAETALNAVGEAREKIPDVPDVPDYKKELDVVRTAQKKYEDSVQKLANVTSPPDSFVMERVEKIKTVAAAEAVTADNDPNGLLGKNGGYIGCVYFLDERVDRDLLPQEAFAKEHEKAAEDGDDAGSESSEEAAASAGTEESSSDDAADSTGSAESSEEAAASAGTAESSEQAEAQAGTIAGSSEAAASAGTEAASNETADNAGTEAASGETADNAGTEAASSETAASADTVAASAESASTAAAAEETAAPENPSGTAAVKENNIDVVMIGTAGGGAVEVFATEEEAKNRAEYIAFFDGSVMEAGPCLVEGTCVIRASRHLEAEDQQKLLREVCDALLSVEE